jgi:hypothetical protein
VPTSCQMLGTVIFVVGFLTFLLPLGIFGPLFGRNLLLDYTHPVRYCKQKKKEFKNGINPLPTFISR